MDFNKIIESFLSANIQFTAIYKIDVPAGSKALGQKTMEKSCGIVIPLSGKAVYHVGGKMFELERGKILFAGASMSLDKIVMGEHGWSYYLVHYQANEKGTDLHLLNHQNFLVKICERNMVRVFYKVQEIFNINKDGTPLSRFKTANMVRHLIEQILEYGMCFNWDSDFEKIQQTIRYIQERFYDELSMVHLADRLSWDIKKFHYEFTKEIGLSPKKFLTAYRMDKAKAMLAEGDGTVAEIARLVGYEDAFHFSRIFKKYEGCSPSDFRSSLGKNP